MLLEWFALRSTPAFWSGRDTLGLHEHLQRLKLAVRINGEKPPDGFVAPSVLARVTERLTVRSPPCADGLRRQESKECNPIASGGGSDLRSARRFSRQ